MVILVYFPPARPYDVFSPVLHMQGRTVSVLYVLISRMTVQQASSICPLLLLAVRLSGSHIFRFEGRMVEVIIFSFY